MLAFVPETVRFTPSDTEARGRAVDAVRRAATESGVAVEVRGGGVGLLAVEDTTGVLPVVVVEGGALGAIDCRLTGFVAEGATEVEFCLGGGMALVAGAVVGFAAGAPALTDFLRAVVADDVLVAGAAVALVPAGAALTAPDPNVPELMICARR